MTHRVSRETPARRWVPFGLGETKPRHYRDMARVAWENRDNLGYAWKVLSRGVCDGCALGVTGFRDWTMDGVHLCMTRLNLLRLNTMPAIDTPALADAARLAERDNRALRRLGRLARPMRRRHGERGFSPIPWDDALARIGETIRAVPPQRIAFYLTARGLTNEVYYVAQKVARFFGTNNIDNAARLCHSPSTGAMKEALGVAASTCSYRDWYGTDLLVFFGANPANDQPVSMKYVHEAKRHGTRVVVVNPYREPGLDRYWVPSTVRSALFGTDVMDYWFPVATGGDIAFLYGVLKHLVANGWHDHEFVARHTSGFEALQRELETRSWEDLSDKAGLPRRSMEEMAELVRDAKTAVFVWSMGITQHARGGDAVGMILDLALCRGFVGRDRCGVMPIRGHSGVQGGAEMGAYATAFPGGLPIDAENAARFSDLYGFDVPTSPGLPAPQMVEAAERGELDLLYCLGGNFLRALPDPARVRTAMQRVPLRVHQDIVLTDQMLIEPPPGGEVLLLPAKTRYEQEGGGTETTTERRILFSPEIPRQVGEARAEWRILLDLAATVAPARRDALGCETAQAIREEIARAVPAYQGIQHLNETDDALQYGGPHLCAGGRFPTTDGKAHFAAPPLPERCGDGLFRLSTRRGKQFNTIVFDETDPLTGAGRDAVFIHPDDAARLGLAAGDPVELSNRQGRLRATVFPAPIAPGNLQVHWPEGNVLIPGGIVDAAGGVPDYNTDVHIEPVAR